MTLPIGPLNEVPIACTLTPDAGQEQVRRWHQFNREHALQQERTTTSLTVHYTRTPGAVAELRALVAIESDCCSFADWRIEDDGAHLRLVVSGSPEQLAALTIG